MGHWALLPPDILTLQQDREAFAISTNRSRSREIGGRRILTCLGCAGQQDAFARVSIFLVSRHYFFVPGSYAAFRLLKGRWSSRPISRPSGSCPPDDRVLYAQLKSGLHIFLFSTGTQNRWFFLSFLVPGRYKTNRHHLNPGAAPKWAKTKNWLVKWVLIHTPLGIEPSRCFCVPTATSAAIPGRG